MIAVRAIFKDGEVKPIEPLPGIETAEVLIIFPEAPRERRGLVAGIDLSAEELEAKFFGAGKDMRTDEKDEKGIEDRKQYAREKEARLFGAGVDLWTDEVDQAVRDSFKPLPRPWTTLPEEDEDASV